MSLKSNNHRSSWSRLVLGIFSMILIVGGVYFGYGFYVTIRDFVAHAQLPSSLPSVLLPPASSQAPERQTEIGSGGERLPDWQEKERVNILLLGIDEREDQYGPWRTDTMIVLTIDPENNTAGMLSIPRDLWVTIPGYSEERINTAHYTGDLKRFLFSIGLEFQGDLEQGILSAALRQALEDHEISLSNAAIVTTKEEGSEWRITDKGYTYIVRKEGETLNIYLEKYPGGGPVLAIKTVQYNLGIPIHYYVRVNFSGFIKAIDTIGGVDIYVEEEINDPKYPDNAYGYDPLYIPAGLQHMDGELALKYARTRHTRGNDFDRLRRQQQVIMAVRDKVLRLGMLPQLLSDLPDLLKTVGDSVQTDLQLTEMINLVQLASQIDEEHIKAATIDSSMTEPTTRYNGAQVLIPIRDEIRAVVDEVFAEPTPEVEEEVITEEREKLAAEGAKIIVHNGSLAGNIAAKTSAFLKEQGFQVVEFDNAERFDYSSTMIVDFTGKEYTIQSLARLLNISQDNIQKYTGSYSEVDIRLIIGADFQLPTAP